MKQYTKCKKVEFYSFVMNEECSVCEFFNFYSSALEVSILLQRGAASLGDWYLMF
jgi:hypothetical protein